MITVLEGYSGAGKTTVLKYLGNLKNSIVLGELPSIFPEPVYIKALKKEIIKGNIEKGIVREKWFLRRDLEREIFSKILLERYKHVFIERDHLSTLAFSKTLDELNENTSYNLLYKEYKKLANKFPSYSKKNYVLLVINEKESIIRQNQRKRKSTWPWYEKEFMPAYIKNWKELVKKIAGRKILEVNTSLNSPEIITEVILSKVLNKKMKEEYYGH